MYSGDTQPCQQLVQVRRLGRGGPHLLKFTCRCCYKSLVKFTGETHRRNSLVIFTGEAHL